MKSFKAHIFLFSLLLLSCEKNVPNPEDKVVLQAYLYANEAVDDIRLTTLIPYGGDDSAAQPVNDALVRIVWREKPYFLTLKNTDGYYHYTGDDLQIVEGERYRIEFEYFNRETWAETQIPPKPEAFEMTGDSIVFRRISFAIDSLILFDDTISLDTIGIRWENSASNYYFVSIDRLDQDARRVGGGLFGIDIDFRVFTEPIQSDSYSVSFIDVSHYGPHAVSLYRVGQEYVDLYENRVQDSRNLREPTSNVVNGLGVFAGFNAVRDTFHVAFRE